MKKCAGPRVGDEDTAAGEPAAAWAGGGRR